MALANLVHFGADTCFRLRVLQSAGFQVAECKSLNELPPALAIFPDAVVLEGLREADAEQAIALTRSQTIAPVIHFASEPNWLDAEVDLEIPPFTPPSQWLAEIRSLIERSRKTIAESRALRKEGSLLRADSAVMREALRSERERLVHDRKRIEQQIARQLIEIDKRTEE